MNSVTYKIMTDSFLYKKNVSFFIVATSVILSFFIAVASTALVIKLKKHEQSISDKGDASQLVSTLDSIFESAFLTIDRFSGKKCDENVLTDMRDAVEVSAYVRALSLTDTSGNIVCSTSRGMNFFPAEQLTHSIADIIRKMRFQHDTRTGLSLVDGTHIVPDKEAIALFTIFPSGMGLGTIDAFLIARNLTSQSHDAVQPFLVISGKKLNRHGEAFVDNLSDDGIEIQSLKYPYKIRIEREKSFQFTATLLASSVFFISSILAFIVTHFCVRRLLSRARCLAHALHAGEITADVQPIFMMKNRKVVGIEILARWILKDGRRIPPSEFIPDAEKCGYINNIASHLITLIADKIDNRELIISEGIKVGFNIHPSHFKSESLIGLCEYFTLKVSRFGVRMVLELTERGELEKDEEMLFIIEKIKSLGVELAIDDFGASSSGLRYLSDSVFDCIKIDRLFLEEASVDKHTGVVLQNSVALAHQLGKDIVVEGIENDSQLNMLRKAFPAYDLMVQGYLWSKPFPVSAFNKWHACQINTKYRNIIS